MKLAPDVYATLVEGDLIFLDAANDQYACVTRTDAGVVVSLLEGRDPANLTEAELVGELANAGLLTFGVGRPFEPAEVVPPLADYHAFAADALPAGWRTLWRLALSAIEGAVRSCGNPSRWLSPQKRRGSVVPVSRACTLAMQFDRLRPWLPRTGRCLPNSLVLLSFLRRHGISANLVVGVHTFPFEAHCWVECQGVILNDTVEHVRWYTPIAVA